MAKYEALGNTYLIEAFKDYNEEDLIYLAKYNQVNYILLYKEKPLELFTYDFNGKKVNLEASGLSVLYGHLLREKIIEESPTYIFSDDEMYKLVMDDGLIDVELPAPKLIKEYEHKDTLTIQDLNIHFTALKLIDYHIIIYVNDEIESSWEYKNIERIFSHPLINKKFHIHLVKLYSYRKLEIKSYHKDYGWGKSISSGIAASCYLSYLINRMDNQIDVITNKKLAKIRIYDERILIQSLIIKH